MLVFTASFGVDLPLETRPLADLSADYLPELKRNHIERYSQRPFPAYKRGRTKGNLDPTSFNLLDLALEPYVTVSPTMNRVGGV